MTTSAFVLPFMRETSTELSEMMEYIIPSNSNLILSSIWYTIYDDSQNNLSALLRLSLKRDELKNRNNER